MCSYVEETIYGNFENCNIFVSLTGYYEHMTLPGISQEEKFYVCLRFPAESFPRVFVADIRKRCDKPGAVAKESRCGDTKARLLA